MSSSTLAGRRIEMIKITFTPKSIAFHKASLFLGGSFLSLSVKVPSKSSASALHFIFPIKTSLDFIVRYFRIAFI